MQQSRARLSFVDGLRLVAALQMIQGHTLDALLANELRQGSWFRAWTFTRGLTSTTFLFTAGVSLALAHAAGELRSEQRVGRARRVKRALLLVAVGYVMRAPFGILFGDTPEAALRNLWVVDVLQCIGVSLLLLEALCGLTQDPRLSAWLSALLGTLCFALAPVSESLCASGAWVVLSNYVSAAHGSLFPLLPAAGYVFFGLSVAQSSLLGRAEHPRRQALGLLAWGLSLLGVARGLFAVLPVTAARLSPAYAALKLGLVLVFAAFLALVLARRALPRVLSQLGSETLFLYVSHVLVLYAGHVGLVVLVGRTQSLGLSLLWLLGLLICTSLGALGYGRGLRALRARFQRGTPRAQSSLPLG